MPNVRSLVQLPVVVVGHPLVQEFLDHLRYERYFSPHTLTCYSLDLNQFASYLAGGKRGAILAMEYRSDKKTTTPSVDVVRNLLLTATTKAIKEYQDFLMDEYLPATVGRKISALKSFYGFCLKRSHIRTNPSADVKHVPNKQRERKILSPRQVQKLMSAIDQTTVLGARDFAILEMMYSTGICGSEIVRLNKSDMNGGHVRVAVPRKRDRVVPVGTTAIEAVAKYWAIRVDSHEAMFVNKHGQRLSTRSVRRKLDKYLKLANMDPGICPRDIRHTHAAHMLEVGFGLADLQARLGHQSIDTTRAYTKKKEQNATEQAAAV